MISLVHDSVSDTLQYFMFWRKMCESSDNQSIDNAFLMLD